MHALRFFRVVPLHSTYMLVGLAALGLFGIAELLVDPQRGMDVGVPVVLLHMFAVSSGFFVPARRGHFDLLLTGGGSRLQIALAHWFVSVTPGLAVWLVLGITEAVLLGRGRGAVFSNGSVAAMVLISMLGWALTVPLPRLSGGVIWLVVLFIALSASGEWRSSLMSAAEGGGSQWSLGVMFVVCPLLMVGTRLGGMQVLALLPGLGLGALATAAAVAWISRSSLSLEASQ